MSNLGFVAVDIRNEEDRAKLEIIISEICKTHSDYIYGENAFYLGEMSYLKDEEVPREEVLKLVREGSAIYNTLIKADAIYTFGKEAVEKLDLGNISSFYVVNLYDDDFYNYETAVWDILVKSKKFDTKIDLYVEKERTSAGKDIQIFYIGSRAETFKSKLN